MQDSVMKVAGEILDRMAELKSFFNDVSKDRMTVKHITMSLRATKSLMHSNLKNLTESLFLLHVNPTITL